MQQRGKPAGFKGVNEHEGLAKGDIDGDGKLDIVGGGRWFKHVGGNQFLPNIIDAGYSFSRSAVGDLKKGGRPEVVLVVGDGEGPLNWYEWVKGTWVPHTIVEVNSGHSLAILDFNNDGNLDIFCAEMRLNGGNPEAKCYLFLGDGNGNFKKTIISIGIGYHESKIADLDGNGTFGHSRQTLRLGYSAPGYLAEPGTYCSQKIVNLITPSFILLGCWIPVQCK